MDSARRWRSADPLDMVASSRKSSLSPLCVCPARGVLKVLCSWSLLSPDVILHLRGRDPEVEEPNVPVLFRMGGLGLVLWSAEALSAGCMISDMVGPKPEKEEVAKDM
jgi:hypothetical protein